MKKLIIRIVVVVVILLVVAVGLSIYFLGSIVKKGVETVGPQITGTETKLDSATLSLLGVGVVPSSVFADKIRVKQIRVEAPEITFEGGLKGNNLSKLLDNVEAAAGSDKTSTASKDKSSS